ncbi:MAG TPA: cytochrome c oxidase subunit 3 [Candidatus Limnocylindria bacterium]|jgi:cytochrome c oxidase subunit 3|nr:cytochrome c oxidase subunit 3 [Candidatus Limnocylindria bacterium]
MEIPYTYKPRPDTGLYNAKVGIWLFLASEVMLFGALFSAYILLRVMAPEGDWPNPSLAWPHGLLNIPIGTFNTWVLITSSVTVVLAWSALKVNNFKRFRVLMTITVLCALSFLSIKSYEYNEKFTHYVLRLKSGEAMTGHMEVAGHHQGFWQFSEMWDLDRLNELKIESFKVLADPKERGGHHEEKEIKTADLQSVGAFVPRTHPFFAIYFLITALHGLHVLGGAIVLFYFAYPGAKMWKTNPTQFENRIEVGGLFWHFVDLVWIFLFPVVYLL